MVAARQSNSPNFTHDKNTRGHYTRCKVCHNEYNKKRRRETPERVHEKDCIYNARHAAYKKAWYEANRDRVLAACRVKYLANREEILERVRHYRRNNLDKERAHGANREAQMRDARGKLNADIIYTMYDDQGGLCAYCETPLFGNFHVDHMVPLISDGLHDWSNVAITCPECNLRKNRKTVEEFMRVIEHGSS